MKKFEHQVDVIHNSNIVDNETKIIKERGLQGWELVNAVHQDAKGYLTVHLYWKREVIEDKQLL